MVDNLFNPPHTSLANFDHDSDPRRTQQHWLRWRLDHVRHFYAPFLNHDCAQLRMNVVVEQHIHRWHTCRVHHHWLGILVDHARHWIKTSRSTVSRTATIVASPTPTPLAGFGCGCDRQQTNNKQTSSYFHGSPFLYRDACVHLSLPQYCSERKMSPYLPRVNSVAIWSNECMI